MALSTPQLDAVQRLVQSAPDALLTRLDSALSVARTGDPVFIPVSDIARAEAEDRRARDIALAPLKPLANQDLQPPRRPQLASGDLARIWKLMKAVSPEAVADATHAALVMGAQDAPAPVFDDLCVAAAAALSDPQTPDAAASWSADDRTRLGKLLVVTPSLRAALPKLDGWVRHLNGDTIPAVRLAFKDVTAVLEDAGPLFMNALMVHMHDATHALRLISAVMDRPSDRYLASSELASVGERLLDDTDRRIAAIRKFDPDRGIEGGAGEASSVFVACNTIKEFEQWIALSKEGPWGSRIATQKQALALAAEGRLKSVEPAVAAALPLQQLRAIVSVIPRATPRIDGPPDDRLVRRAEALLAFLDETRSSAANGGFGALRTAVIASLQLRIDTYVQDLLDRLHEGEDPDAEWVRAYLDVAADFSGMIQGPQAAQLVRRRAAAA